MGSRIALDNLPTMMPFLYQTRTLSNMNWTRTSAVCRSQYKNISIRRNFSSHHASISRTASKPVDGTNAGEFQITRTTNMQGAEPGSRSNCNLNASKKPEGEDGANGGLLIRRTFDESPRASDARRDYNPNDWHTSPRYNGRATPRRRVLGVEAADDMDFTQPGAIEFDEDIDEDMFSAKDEIADLTGILSHETRESTITDSERHAFQRIFSDIFSRNQKAGVSPFDEFNECFTGKSTGEAGREKANLKFDNILSSAIGRQSQTREEMENVVSRYPTALRAAAARAIGLTEAEAEAEENASYRGKALDTQQLEALREPERKRVEGLMNDAKTDFELWEVLEKEVFSLIPKLGLEDVAKPVQELPVEAPKKNKGGKKAKPKSTVEEDAVQSTTEATSTPTAPPIESMNGVSPLALYGPLYPFYLLLSLRLLDRSFSKSSSLALSLLPKIKSLGLISHVLGATTQFYNELLRIYRYRQDDYRSILGLLKEMDHSGLDLDEETLEIVVDIMRMQARVRRGEKGEALKALWALPEFAPGKLKIWRESIGQGIRGKKVAAGARMRY